MLMGIMRLVKKKEEEEEEEEERNLGMERLSSLPEELVIHILSFLETKEAIQASLSLKKWVNLWTLIPNLHFDTSLFDNLSSFNKFVSKVLTLHGSVKVNKFHYRSETSKFIPEILKFVVSHEVQHLTFDVVSHGVQHLTFDASTEEDVFLDRFGSCDSVRSLKLRVSPFHGSICLKQVVTLHLHECSFFEPELFSGCPNLKNLTLCVCWFKTNYSSDMSPVHIVAPQLSRLTMLFWSGGLIYNPRLVLSTPRLTSFKIVDYSVPLLQADDLAFLDTVDADVGRGGFFPEEIKCQLFSTLISFLKCFGCAKSVRISSDMVKILSEFPDALAREPSPFCNLRSVNIASHKTLPVMIPDHVRIYLLGKSPHAKTVFERRSYGGIAFYRHHFFSWNPCSNISQDIEIWGQTIEQMMQ